MQPLEFLVPLGALDAVAGALAYLVLVLVLVNLGTRYRAHQVHKSQAQNGGEPSRYGPHLAANLALVLVSFLYMIPEPHGGMVLSALVVGMVVSDFFELEARQLEARNEMEIERPKSAMTLSGLVLLYAAYQALFWIVAPYWEIVV